jgi:hypothetical protein
MPGTLAMMPKIQMSGVTGRQKFDLWLHQTPEIWPRDILLWMGLQSTKFFEELIAKCIE